MVLERRRVPDNLENMELLAQKLRLGFGGFLGFSERSCLPFHKAAADLPLICGNLDLTFTGLVSVLHVCSMDVNDPKTDRRARPDSEL